MADSVFICYSHADSGQIVDRLDWLHEAGFEPWFDEHITGGSVWRDAISDAIEASVALIFFVSPRSIASDRCLEEVDFALELDVPVLSVYLERTQLNNRLLFRLSNRQIVEAYRLPEETFRERLIGALRAAVQPAANSPSPGLQNRSGQRLVVLPLRNLTGDSSQEFFCDGLMEDTINRLGRAHDRLGVIARSSAMLYKDTAKTVAEIGAELGVDHVLEGSLRHSRDALRISVSLINAADQTQIWSEVYERSAEDAFDVHDEIASGVARSLRLGEAQADAVSPGGKAAAREAFLKGRFHWYHHTAADYPVAIAYFEEAIRLDPEYAPGYIGLADTIATTAHRGEVAPSEVYPESKRLVEKALSLDDGAAEAHDQKGRIAFAYDFDRTTAEIAFKRAIELNPSYPDAYVIYAQLLAATGRRTEALEFVHRGLRLDPHNVFLQVNLGIQLGGVGRCEEAIEVLQRIPQDVGFADEMLWGVCYRAGHYASALGHSARYFADDEEVGSALAQTGPEVTAQDYFAAMSTAAAVLAGRSSDRYVAPSQIARLYTHAEAFESAIGWLHKAVDIRDSWVVYSTVMAEYYKLWEDPAFQEVRERMDLLEIREQAPATP